jgi:beta-galactosidase
MTVERISLNRNWEFIGGDSIDFQWSRPDKSSWRKVDLPHDWSIEQAHAADKPSLASGGYFPMGIGLYTKRFSAPDEWRDKTVLIEFEGVYMNAEVWLNDHLISRHPYGYTSFQVDLTPYLEFGEFENQLRVKVDNTHQRNSRWYSGSGIYRPAWLLVADPIHISPWGVYVTTPQVSSDSAQVRVLTSIENLRETTEEAVVRTKIINPEGKALAVGESSIHMNQGNTEECIQVMQVENPSLWSTEQPVMYRLHSEVVVKGQVVDTLETAFGIRSLEFSAERGFLLNGHPTLMRGGCVHHDNGILGAASYARSEERKVEVHKANGYNAIRCAHNPPSPAFLEACDRLGMLVIDEAFDCWREGKNLGDYHVAFDDWWQRDIESMVLRDRNHPCVVVWSIGNELIERMKPEGAQIARMLAEYIRSLDPTRPITAAINGAFQASGAYKDPPSWKNSEEIFRVLDIGGYNYQQKQYADDSKQFPQRIIFGTESTAREALEHWMDVKGMPNVIGDFVWTSLDYLGEAGIGRVTWEGEPFEFLGRYPWHQANCGDLDLCGFKRPQSYYRDILWERGEKLYIAVHDPTPEGKVPVPTYWGWPEVWHNWNWPGNEGQEFTVDVYSACEEVELFLNGHSLGKQPTNLETRFTASFKVPYEPGELKAVGQRQGKPAAECTLQTVGEPASIRLSPDRETLKAAYGDLCFIKVEIVDVNGRVHPSASNEVFFTLQGPGVITAVGSSNPVSKEKYVGNQRKAHRGTCMAVVKTLDEAGTITLHAQADGLPPAEITIKAA